jgi:hypothetical protein
MGIVPRCIRDVLLHRPNGNGKLAEELRKRFEGYIGKPKGEPVIH